MVAFIPHTALECRNAFELPQRRGHRGPGSGWVASADPEGNEFCVVRPREEKGAS